MKHSKDNSTRPGARELEVTVATSRRGYRLFAPLYDHIFGLSLQHGRRLSVAALDLRPGERVLEVGVGSGLALPLYPGYVSVFGIDISNDMLGKARRRVQRRKLNQMQALLAMDAEDMSFVDASFDKAVVMYAASGFPDPLRAMAELRRVCKPDATLVIANHFRSETPLARLFDLLLAPLYRLLRYRADLDASSFAEAAGLDVIERKPANLFGYSTLLICRNRDGEEPWKRPLAVTRSGAASEELRLGDEGISLDQA